MKIGDGMETATTLRLPLKHLKALKVISTLEDQSMNKIIQRLVEEYLEDYYDLQEAKESMAETGEIPWEVIKQKLEL